MNRGFTLVELLVVIAIIGILAGLVGANVNSARVRARDAQRIADLKSMQTALELYAETAGSYPVQLTATQNGLNDPALTPLVPRYISALPKDPLLSRTGTAQYVYWSDGKSYRLRALLEQQDHSILQHDLDDLAGVNFSTCNDTPDPYYCLGMTAF